MAIMQSTRRHILDILKTNGASTVEEIVAALHQLNEKKVTAATVRHHLDILQEEGLIEAPDVRRRESPGRPQYVYQLTQKALDFFPSNYAALAHGLLTQIKTTLSGQEVNVILEGVAAQMSAQAAIPDVPMEERLDYVVHFLTQQGYQATWDVDPSMKGYLLCTSNCPFEKVAPAHQEICGIDMQLVSNLLGVVPRRLGRVVEGEKGCTYFIRKAEESVPTL